MIEKGRMIGKNGEIINDPSVQGLCMCCNKAKQARDTRTTINGESRYKPYCSHCLDIKNEYKRDRFRGSKDYRKNVKESCERCGFIPEHICQLDVDHIDNNHNNDEESNLQTLCANCHRLKTQNHKDLKKNKRIEIVKSYFEEKKKINLLKEKTKVFRKGVDYMQYKLRLPENSSKEEVEIAFNEYILEFKKRIGQEEYNRRRQKFIETLSKSSTKSLS